MIAEGVLNNKKVVISSDRKNYWRYYGLKFDPFAVLPKETVGYLPAQREQQFDILNYLCHSSNVLMTIIGNKGVGKTMFLKQFIAQLDDSVQVQQLLGSRQLGFAQLVDAIEKNFSMATPLTDNQEDKLDNLLTSFQLQEKRCLLVIDDAHLLPKESLNALLYFVRHQSESQMQFHILLVGQPLLSETLNHLSEEGTDQELIHNLGLTTFNADEAQGYIKYRLHNAGLPAAIPLSQFAITRIHKLSHGIPERINVIAKQYLIEAMQQKQLNSATNFMKDYKTEVIGGGLILAILLLVATFWSHGSRYPMIPSFGNLFSGYHFKLPSFAFSHKNPAVNVNASITEGAPSVVQMSSFDANSMNNQVSPVSAPTPVKPVAQAVVAPIASNFNAKNTVKTVQAPVAKVASVATNKVATYVMQPTNTLSVGAVNNLNNTQQALLNNSFSRGIIPAAANTVNAVSTAPVLVKNNVASSVAPAAADPKQQGFLAMNPNHFALQLIGLSSEGAMKQFIAKNQLGSNARYFHSHLNGKDWYVLVYGDYESRSAATAAVQSLPMAVQAQHPWVRALSSVQSSVRKQMMTATNAQTTQ